MIICLWLICSCMNPGNESALDILRETKQELKDQGFKEMEIKDPLDNRSYSSDNSYYKEYGDTVVQFMFDGDLLATKEIIFERDKFDSVEIFRNLDKKGFTVSDTSFKNLALTDLHGRKYLVHRNRRQIVLIYTKRKAEIPAPTTLTTSK